MKKLILILLSIICLSSIAEATSPTVVATHPRLFLNADILTTLRSRVTPVADGGLGTHTATYTALKTWCDTYWGNAEYENLTFGTSDRFYDQGMMRYALIYVLGAITNTAAPYDYTTHTINDYGDKAKDLLVAQATANPSGGQNYIEFSAITYDWVNARLSAGNKQTVVTWWYSLAPAQDSGTYVYRGYYSPGTPNSFYPGLAFYGDGVTGTYGARTGDQLAQWYVDFIPTFLFLQQGVTQMGGTYGGNKSGGAYTNYIFAGSFNWVNIARPLYTLPISTDLTTAETWKKYIYGMSIVNWMLHLTYPGTPLSSTYSFYPYGGIEIPLAMWDDFAYIGPNSIGAPSVPLSNVNGPMLNLTLFDHAKKMYYENGDTTTAQFINWFEANKLNYTSHDDTLNILFNDKILATTYPAAKKLSVPFGWNEASGVIDSFSGYLPPAYTTPATIKGGIGEINMRSSWTADNPTVSIFRASPFDYPGDHSHRDSLAFSIWKGEWLALPNTGIYNGNYEGGEDYNDIGFPHHWQYFRRNTANNSILIMNPSDVSKHVDGGSNGTGWTIKDGGQKSYKCTPALGIVFGGIVPNDDCDWGGLTHYEDATNYTYTSADATKVYPPANTSLVQRDYVYLKSSGGDDDFFVTFDRVNSADVSYKKVWLLHTAVEPVISGTTQTFGGTSGGLYEKTNVSSFTVTGSTGKMKVSTLLPSANHVYKIGGTASSTVAVAQIPATDTGVGITINVASSADFSITPTVLIGGSEWFKCTGKGTGTLTGCLRARHVWKTQAATAHDVGAVVLEEFPWTTRDVDTGNWTDHPWYNSQVADGNYFYIRGKADEKDLGAWTVRVENTTNESTTNFLHVMQPVLSAGTFVTATLVSADTMYGALIAGTTPRVVLFAKSSGQAPNVTYSVTYSGTGRHLITGLIPNTAYYFYHDGTKGSPKTSSAQGVIAFDSTNGSFRLSAPGLVVDDTNIYTPPATGRPAKGTPYTDVNYGNTVTRITNAPDDCHNPTFGDVCWNLYPKASNENADGTRLIIGQMGGSCYNLFNATTFAKIKSILNFPNICSANADPRWDATDPNIFYYSYYGKFYKYDIRDDSYVLLHDFTIDWPGCNQTMAEEGDSSTDSRYWGFRIGCYTPPNIYWTQAFLTYDKDFYGRNNGKILSKYELGDAGWNTGCVGDPLPNCFNSTSMSPNGDYFIMDADGPVLSYPSGNISAATQKVLDCANHSDLAIDSTGRQVIVCACMSEPTTPTNCKWSRSTGYDWWIKMVDIITGDNFWLKDIGPVLYNDYTDARNIDFDSKFHISGNNVYNPGWGVVSVWGPLYGSSTLNHWTGHSIFGIELTRAGTGLARVWNIAQTHNYLGSNDVYYDPFGKINKTGTKIWFTSDWDADAGPGSGQVDVYQIDLPTNWAALLAGSGVGVGGEEPPPEPPADTSSPIVTAFTIPSTAVTLTVAISSFTCTDNTAVTGYCVTTTNSSSGCSWSGSAPSFTTFSTGGVQTAYGWCRDAANNISTSTSDSVTITLPPPIISGTITFAPGGGTMTTGVGGVITLSYTAPLTDQTISFSDPSDMVVGDADQALTCTATSGLACAFSTNNVYYCSIVDNKLHAVGPSGVNGCIVYADQAGNQTYRRATQVSNTVTITSGSANTVADNFNRTAEDPLSNGGKWTSWNIGDYTYKLKTNGTQLIASGSGAVNGSWWSGDTVTANQFAQITVTTCKAYSEFIKLFVRATDSSGQPSGYSLLLNGCDYNIGLFKETAGVPVQIGAWNTQTTSDGDKLRIEATGTTTTTIKACKNPTTDCTTGTLLFNETDSSSPYTYGWPGIGMKGTGTMVLDNFTGGDL